MTFIRTITEGEASGEVDALYRRQRGDKNYLPNYAPVFCCRPKILDALGVRADSIFTEFPESLRELLVVGRQIDGALETNI
jgi:hypothetical protein